MLLLLRENVSTGPRRLCSFACLMGRGRGSGDVCEHVPLPSPAPRESPTTAPTWDGHPASSGTTGRAGAGVLAAGDLAGGCVHAATHCAPAAQAAGGTLEGLHAAVPLDVQVLESPAFPALPKLHLDLPWEKEGNKSHHANQLPTERPRYYISREGKKIRCIISRDTSQGLRAPKLISQ